MEHSLVFSIFLIFTGAAILATLALLTRQSMLVAYLLLGIFIGPWSLKFIGDPAIIQKIGNVGIIFLLFLLGLHLPPQKLLHMLKKVSWIALVSSIIFAVIGYGVGHIFGYTPIECLIIGAAMMFSSTIMGIKLLPTTVLHHQHVGAVMISILLLQDLIAIVVLLVIHASVVSRVLFNEIAMVIISFPAIFVFAFILERFVLLKLFSKFNRIKEYLFLITIAWCLSMSQLAAYLGLSHEIGAFIAGVSLAANPISLYIAENLKPLRDFFLVLFFFSIGASFDLNFFPQVLMPALLLTLLFFIIKPVVYQFLLHKAKEPKTIGWEVGARLGQISEFSLIIAYVSLSNHLIGNTAAYLIQATTIFSFIVSSYLVVLKYPTPIAFSDNLRRD